MPTIKFTVAQIEKMLITRARDAASCLGVQDIIDPNKGYSVRSTWNHFDSDDNNSKESENFNSYRSWIEITFDERY
tara:strand:- start:1616 stop:1843 length:228 start_codon:yes stop_codon:yes gene_type:complete